MCHFRCTTRVLASNKQNNWAIKSAFCEPLITNGRNDRETHLTWCNHHNGMRLTSASMLEMAKCEGSFADFRTLSRLVCERWLRCPSPLIEARICNTSTVTRKGWAHVVHGGALSSTWSDGFVLHMIRMCLSKEEAIVHFTRWASR